MPRSLFTSETAKQARAQVPRIPLVDRVFRYIRISTTHDACWEWTGTFSIKRRGQMRPVIQVGGRGTPVVIVARLICEWFHGPPPTDKHEAGHTCPHGENASCCHPGHLRWMTRTENERYKSKDSVEVDGREYQILQGECLL